MKSNLKEIRDKANLSLDEVAGMCGLTKSRVWELEKDSNPTLKTAYSISKVLGVSVEDIWPNEIEIVEETITVRRVK